jgi:hypothetical protein
MTDDKNNKVEKHACKIYEYARASHCRVWGESARVDLSING